MSTHNDLQIQQRMYPSIYTRHIKDIDDCIPGIVLQICQCKILIRPLYVALCFLLCKDKQDEKQNIFLFVVIAEKVGNRSRIFGVCVFRMAHFEQRCNRHDRGHNKITSCDLMASCFSTRRGHTQRSYSVVLTMCHLSRKGRNQTFVDHS